MRLVALSFALTLLAVVGAAAMGSVVPHAVHDTVQLYLGGKTGQWYPRKDKRGVMFAMNVTTKDEARDLLEKLPLGVVKIMRFDLIPLGPLSLLIFLSAPATPAAK